MQSRKIRTKRKANTRSQPKIMPTLRRNQDMRLIYKMDYSSHGNQYGLMSTPLCSSIVSLDTLTSTVRLSAQEVDWSKMVLTFQSTTAVDIMTRYRLIVIRVVNRYAYAATLDPNTIVTATVTTTNFPSKPFRVPRDQDLPYSVLVNRFVTQDTHYGHDPLKKETRIAIPKHSVEYDPDDATGVTKRGQLIFFVLTDATAGDAGYTWSVWAQMKYRLRF